MQEQETIIRGVPPPQKGRRTAKIAAIVLFFGFFGASAWFFASGRGDVFLRKTANVAVLSWKEVLGVATDAPIHSEVDIASDANVPSAQGISSTSDAGTNNFQGDLYAAKAEIKKSTRKISKVGDGVVAVPGDIAITSASDAPTDEAQQNSPLASLSDTTITDPIAVLGDPGEADGLNVASSNSSSAKNFLQCTFPDAATATILPRVILNEIAWMGSPTSSGLSATQSANREWIELQNITTSPIDLAGWQVSDSAGNIHAFLGAGAKINAGGFYLLSRDGNEVEDVSADAAYSGGLSNTGEIVGVFDQDCGISDLLDASSGWPAGDNATKQTLERKADRIGWQTSLLPGGTPRAENSIGAVQSAVNNAGSSSTYAVEVTIVGDGGGKIVSKPSGIACSTAGVSVCTAEYAVGTLLTLTASNSSSATFAGWTGPCSGFLGCAFPVNGPISVTAQFRSAPSSVEVNDSASTNAAVDEGEASATILASSSPPAPISENQTQPSSSDGLSPPNHIIIAQVQIAGASSSNDFVKLYNPTASSIDVSGWKLDKKSSTGVDYSLRVMPKGSLIGAGLYFVWANSLNQFAQSIGADVSSTETLSADNSVALLDVSGSIVDAVAWGTGTNQYGVGPPYAMDPGPSQILARRTSGGIFVDEGNNSTDFTLQ